MVDFKDFEDFVFYNKSELFFINKPYEFFLSILFLEYYFLIKGVE